MLYSGVSCKVIDYLQFEYKSVSFYMYHNHVHVINVCILYAGLLALTLDPSIQVRDMHNTAKATAAAAVNTDAGCIATHQVHLTPGLGLGCLTKNIMRCVGMYDATAR